MRVGESVCRSEKGRGGSNRVTSVRVHAGICSIVVTPETPNEPSVTQSFTYDSIVSSAAHSCSKVTSTSHTPSHTNSTHYIAGAGVLTAGVLSPFDDGGCRP